MHLSDENSKNQEPNIPWHFLVGKNSCQRILILDYKLEYSAISFSKIYDEVYLFNLTFKYLQIIKEYADLNYIQNIRYFCGSTTPFLPFKDDNFDVVFINSELLYNKNKLLPEIGRILKQNGTLCYFAENKFSYKKMKNIIKFWAILFDLKPYRKRNQNRLSSYEHIRQLKNAGFEYTKIYSILPNPEEIESIEDPDRIKKIFNKKKPAPLKRSFNLKNILTGSCFVRKYLMPNLAFFSNKKGIGNSELDFIIADI